MSNTIDSILTFLKWPVAVVAVLLVPGSLLATFEVVFPVLRKPMACNIPCGGCGDVSPGMEANIQARDMGNLVQHAGT